MRAVMPLVGLVDFAERIKCVKGPTLRRLIAVAVLNYTFLTLLLYPHFHFHRATFLLFFYYTVSHC